MGTGVDHDERATGSAEFFNFSSLIRRINARKSDPPPRSRPRAPTAERLDCSRADVPITDLARYSTEASEGDGEKRGTVLYLAYGSNLCRETFQGSRGIQPLSQLNVVVPELRMTFDLPGIPYTEPCFANTARRDPSSEAAPTAARNGYHKDRWKKGLVGVVYEVTPSDYAHIIATEGGGASYQDVLVDCYALAPGVDDVPATPSGTPFKAHTLFAPYRSPGSAPPPHGGRTGRPDPAYAQPSARYLKLITDGAEQHGIPAEYRAYLRGLRPYRVTTQAQRAGQFVLLTLWGPFILLLFSLMKVFQNPKTGVAPPWLAWLAGELFASVWRSYDVIFKKYFGDGERTIGEGGAIAPEPEGWEGAQPQGLRGSLEKLRRAVTIKDEEMVEQLVDVS